MKLLPLALVIAGAIFLGTGQADFGQILWNRPVVLDNAESGVGVSKFLEEGKVVTVRVQAEAPVEVSVLGWALDRPLTEEQALLLRQTVTDASLAIPLPRSALWEIAVANGIDAPNSVTTLIVKEENRAANVALTTAGGTSLVVGVPLLIAPLLFKEGRKAREASATAAASTEALSSEER